ncbi:hypothetical protein [Rhodococcus sp. OK519]|uniref:hypothetical protein n=1 Tax=Rhodococcus sp. OK519 TaxID=2135729 RepID=UPI000D3382CA
MRIRHLIAAVPVALLVLTGCSDGGDADSKADGKTTVTVDPSADAQDSAVSVMCAQVVAYLDATQQQAEAADQPFDRAAKGNEFLDTLKANGGTVVAAYNQQAQASGEPMLDPATATWDDVPAEARELIEQSVQSGIAGSC